MFQTHNQMSTDSGQMTIFHSPEYFGHKRGWFAWNKPSSYHHLWGSVVTWGRYNLHRFLKTAFHSSQHVTVKDVRFNMVQPHHWIGFWLLAIFDNQHWSDQVESKSMETGRAQRSFRNRFWLAWDFRWHGLPCKYGNPRNSNRDMCETWWIQSFEDMVWSWTKNQNHERIMECEEIPLIGYDMLKLYWC